MVGASKSQQYPGVSGCCLQDSASDPPSTESNPTSFTIAMAIFFAVASSPATATAKRPGVPAG